MSNTVNKTEKKKNKGPRFNVIDALIILLIIGSIVGVFLRFDFVDKIIAKNTTSEHNVKFTTTIEYTSDCIEIGRRANKVYFVNSDPNDKTDVEMGSAVIKMENITTPTGEKIELDGDGRIPDSTKIKIEGTIVCQAVSTEKGDSKEFYINGTKKITRGETITVAIGDKMYADIYISDIASADPVG